MCSDCDNSHMLFPHRRAHMHVHSRVGYISVCPLRRSLKVWPKCAETEVGRVYFVTQNRCKGKCLKEKKGSVYAHTAEKTCLDPG